MKLDILKFEHDNATTIVSLKIEKLKEKISLARIHGTMTDDSAIELLSISHEILIEHSKRESYIKLLKDNYNALDKAHVVSCRITQDLLNTLKP